MAHHGGKQLTHISAPRSMVTLAWLAIVSPTVSNAQVKIHRRTVPLLLRIDWPWFCGQKQD